MERATWKIKVKSHAGGWTDLNLPVLIGSSATADVVVHSPAVPARAKLLTADDGKLWCWDLQREVFQEEHGLEAYGIEIRGPFPTNLGQGLRLLQNVAQKEQAWLDSLPFRWKGLVGAHMPRLRRWSWYVMFGLGCLMILATAMRPSRAELIDRSRTPLVMSYGQISKSKFGQSADLLDFRHGLTFRFRVPEEARGHDHAFEFQLGGIDKAGEIEIVANGKKLYSSTVRPECVDDFCRVAVLVPGVFTDAKTVDLILVHREPGSPYLLTNTLFDELRPLSDQERIAAERRLALAQRLYNERAVSYQNLISAKKEIKQVLEIVRLRSDVGTIRDEAKSLDEDLEEEIAAQTEDMWFQSKRFIRLGDYRDAMNQLRGLLEFYPDPGHPRSTQITKALKQLEEVM